MAKAKVRAVGAARVRAADVTVKVDARLKKRWDALLAAIQGAEARGADAFDELWEAAAEVVDHDPPLYVLGGYATAPEFFRAVLHVDERLGRRMIRVARFATPKEEAAYGTSLLDAAIAYVEAKLGHAIDGALPVAFERMKIPVVREGKARRVGLAGASVAEIQAATRALHRKSATDTGSAARRALAAALAPLAKAHGVRVHEANGFASFTHVPLAALATFREALLAVRLPGVATAAKPKRGAKRTGAKAKRGARTRRATRR